MSKNICFYIILGIVTLAFHNVLGQEGNLLEEGYEEEFEEAYVDPYFEEEQKPIIFSKEKIEEARAGIDFEKDYKTQKEKEKASTPNVDTGGLGSFAAGAIKALFIIGLISIIALVLFSMIGNGMLFKPKSKKITGSVTALDLEEIEDNLEDSDIESFLKQALSDNDYKVAIRLYFLIAIRDLSKNNFIKWKKDKTNRDYIRETRDLNFGNHFRETAHIYEKAWYGDFDVLYADFKVIEQKFNTLIDQIKIKGA